MEFLLKWKDLPAWKVTWEDLNAASQRFSHFYLEDKVPVWAHSNGGNQRKPPVLFSLTLEQAKREKTIKVIKEVS